MKKLLLTSFAIILTTFGFGQSDTIYLNNEKIACSVKEITPDAIKYTYRHEKLINSVYKNSVQKIVFKNGRVQIFSEATSLKKVEKVDDFENVAISKVEGEVRGLFKVGEVSAKAKGTTVYSNLERVKERAYRKLKIKAAMMGANIIYMTNQQTESNKMGGYYESGSTTATNLTGIAYTNQLPSFEEFKKSIGATRSSLAVSQVKLWSSGSDMSKSDPNKMLIIDDITNDNGLIMIEGKLEGVSKYSKFRVVSFTKDHFNIFYEDKSSAYNITVKL